MQTAAKYAPYIIKEYEFWTLLIHCDRPTPYIGRAVAWWKDREPSEGEGLTLLNIAGVPSNELFRKVFVDVVRGCKALGHNTAKLGVEFLINTSYLANEESHNHQMHWHFVPRWKQPFHMDALGGKVVVDPCWGRNYHEVYATQKGADFSLPEHELQTIRSIMAKAIE